MDQFELVEKLVNTFGVSYEKAKEALEASNWDAIDAAIYLEKEQNGEGHETKQEAESAQPNVNTNVKGSTANTNHGTDWKNESEKFFKKIWNFLSLNRFVVKKNTGEIFLELPIWLTVTLMCAFFWAFFVVMVIVFIMGYRFSFEGPQLGKKNVQKAVDQVESMTEDFVEKVKNTVGPDEVEPVNPQNSQPEIVIDSTPETNQTENTSPKNPEE